MVRGASSPLKGTVSRLTRGTVNSEVIVTLAGGNTVCAIVTNDSVDEMGLVEGAEVAALFKASSVILGMPTWKTKGQPMQNLRSHMLKIRRLLGGAILLLFCGAAAGAEPLTVAVAANVKYAFEDLAAEFKKETGIEVQGVFGASGQIVAQVKSGAPYDVFLSADTEYPEALYKDGLATAAPRVYAIGVLVLWTRKDIDLGKGIAAVNDPVVAKVAIANPKLAPYGRAAIQALEKAGLSKSTGPKLVYGESIGQTLQFADAGAADVAFVAKSQVISAEMAGRGTWVEVPRGSYDAIAQSVVMLKHGAEYRPDVARKFVDFLFTPKARAIFEKYGYILP